MFSYSYDSILQFFSFIITRLKLINRKLYSTLSLSVNENSQTDKVYYFFLFLSLYLLKIKYYNNKKWIKQLTN